jgi:hypothetical protein
MIKINRHHSVRRLLLTAALPFALLAVGAMSAHARAVTDVDGFKGGKVGYTSGSATYFGGLRGAGGADSTANPAVDRSTPKPIIVAPGWSPCTSDACPSP